MPDQFLFLLCFLLISVQDEQVMRVGVYRSEHDGEFTELLWDHGPTVRRAHVPATTAFPPFTCGATVSSRAQEKYSGRKAGGALGCMVMGMPMAGHDFNMDDVADDENGGVGAVPWMHFSILDDDGGGGGDTAALPPDYCPRFLSELPALAGPSKECHSAAALTARAEEPPAPLPAPKPARPSDGDGVMNFSFFSRPAVAMAREGPQSGGSTPAAAASNRVGSTVVQTASRLRNTPLFTKQRMAWLQQPKETRVTPTPSTTQPVVCNQQVDTARTPPQGVQLEDKAPGAAVATSSVCSGNGDRSQLKRKHQAAAECSASQDEDLDDEPGVLRRSGNRGTKRCRTAEVHNLSERRRRDRINEKMRALQELIPNCNKIDKASMLDEAIEYLKTLQLQVQMMSMGTSLCFPPMMLPPAMATPMAHFAHLGMGLGYGMGAFDMVQLPRVPSLQFPCPMIPNAPMAMPPSTAALPMFTMPGQAFRPAALFPQASGPMATTVQEPLPSLG